MPFSYRTTDGGLHIVGACPADIGSTRVWPVQVPGGRLILVAQRHDEARRFDARTIVTGARHRGISRFDLLSGEAYPPAAGEQVSSIWDVATATLPGGRAVVVGAGVRRARLPVDAATGERIGAPLSRHRAILKAVTTAVSADREPMFISGCERGRPALGRGDRRPDRGTALRSRRRCPSPRRRAPARRTAGLACVDTYALHRWDLPSGESLGPPVRVGKWADLVATHVDRHGIPSAFL